MAKRRAKLPVAHVQWERRSYEVLRVLHTLEGIDTFFDVDAVCRPRAFFWGLPLRLRRLSRRLGVAAIPEYKQLPIRLPALDSIHLASLRNLVVDAVRHGVDARPAVLHHRPWIESAADAAAATAREVFATHRECEALTAVAYWCTWFLRQLILAAPGYWQAAANVAETEFLRGCLSSTYRETYQAALAAHLAGEMARRRTSKDVIVLPPPPRDPPAIQVQLAHLTRTLESTTDWPAIADIAMRGDDKPLRGAFRILGVHAFEWKWLRQVVEGWRYQVNAGTTSKARASAQKKLRAIGEALAFGRGRTGRPEYLDEVTLARCRSWREELRPLVKEARDLHRKEGPTTARRFVRGCLPEAEAEGILRQIRAGDAPSTIAYTVIAKRQAGDGEPVKAATVARWLRQRKKRR